MRLLIHIDSKDIIIYAINMFTGGTQKYFICNLNLTENFMFMHIALYTVNVQSNSSELSLGCILMCHYQSEDPPIN